MVITNYVITMQNMKSEFVVHTCALMNNVLLVLLTLIVTVFIASHIIYTCRRVWPLEKLRTR